MPELPEFQLSLRPDDYELPEIDAVWDSESWENLGQPLKEHLRDSEEDEEVVDEIIDTKCELSRKNSV